MGGHMDDEEPRSICVGNGSPFSLGPLARIDLDPVAYKLLYPEKEDPGLDKREHLLGRITPGEMVYITYACLHPEQTDAEISCALVLRESTVQAYYNHLHRNFNVRTLSELRFWANNRNLVPDDEPEVGKPDETPPDLGFDPWARWY